MKLKALSKKQIQRIKYSKLLLKSKLRNKILKIREKNNKKNVQINFSQIIKILKKKK